MWMLSLSHVFESSQDNSTGELDFNLWKPINIPPSDGAADFGTMVRWPWGVFTLWEGAAVEGGWSVRDKVEHGWIKLGSSLLFQRWPLQWRPRTMILTISFHRNRRPVRSQCLVISDVLIPVSPLVSVTSQPSVHVFVLFRQIGKFPRTSPAHHIIAATCEAPNSVQDNPIYYLRGNGMQWRPPAADEEYRRRPKENGLLQWQCARKSEWDITNKLKNLFWSIGNNLVGTWSSSTMNSHGLWDYNHWQRGSTGELLIGREHVRHQDSLTMSIPEVLPFHLSLTIRHRSFMRDCNLLPLPRQIPKSQILVTFLRAQYHQRQTK
jgi:hypothetical protein